MAVYEKREACILQGHGVDNQVFDAESVEDFPWPNCSVVETFTVCYCRLNVYASYLSSMVVLDKKRQKDGDRSAYRLYRNPVCTITAAYREDTKTFLYRVYKAKESTPSLRYTYFESIVKLANEKHKRYVTDSSTGEMVALDFYIGGTATSATSSGSGEIIRVCAGTSAWGKTVQAWGVYDKDKTFGTAIHINNATKGLFGEIGRSAVGEETSAIVDEDGEKADPTKRKGYNYYFSPAAPYTNVMILCGRKNIVKFDANGGTGVMAQTNAYPLAGDVISGNKLPANTFTNGDKIFAGWNTKADGTGISIPDEGSKDTPGVLNSSTWDAEIILYAQWRGRNTKIVRNGEGGVLKLYASVDGYKSPVATEENGVIDFETSVGVKYKLVCEGTGALYTAKGVETGEGVFQSEYVFNGGAEQNITYVVKKNSLYYITSKIYKKAAESDDYQDWEAAAEDYPANAVTIIGAPDETDGGGYLPGSKVDIKIVPPTGYLIDEVAINNASDNFSNQTLPEYKGVTFADADITIRVIFKEAIYSASARAANNQTAMFDEVNVSPLSGKYGVQVTFTATTLPGYVFDKWTRNGDTVEGAGATHTIVLTENVSLIAWAKPETYSVSVEKGDDEVSGFAITSVKASSDSVKNGEKVHLEANLQYPWKFAFSGWYVGQKKVSSDLEADVTVNGATKYTAKANWIQYRIATTRNEGIQKIDENTTQTEIDSPSSMVPIGAIGTEPGMNVHYDDIVTLKATVAEDYDFDGWYENGTKLDNASETLVFSVTGDRALEARAVKKCYSVGFKKEFPPDAEDALDVKMYKCDDAEGANAVLLEGDSAILEHGDYVKFVARIRGEYEGKYYWNGWDEDDSSEKDAAKELVKQVTGPISAVAKQAWHEYGATIAPSDDGIAEITVKKNGEEMEDDGYSFYEPFHYDDQIEVKAKSREGYYFARWENGESEIKSMEATYSFAIRENTTLYAVSAEMMPETQTVRVVADEALPNAFKSLTINGNAAMAKIEVGGTATIYYELNDGYAIAAWYDKNGNAIRPETEQNGKGWKFAYKGSEADGANAEYVVRASVKRLFRVYVFPGEDSEGAFSGFTVNEKTYDTYGMLVDGAVSVQANMNPHWTFSYWMADQNRVPAPTFRTSILTGDLRLTAYAVRNEYTVSAMKGTGVASASVVDAGGANVAKAYGGAQVRFSAIVNAGYRFVRWENSSGEMVSGEQDYETAIFGNTTLTAVAEKETYQITVFAEPQDAFTHAEVNKVNGQGDDYTYGETIRLSAETKSGWGFDGWRKEDGTPIDLEKKLALNTTVFGNAVYMAKAKRIVHISVDFMGNADMGSVHVTEPGINEVSAIEDDYVTLYASAKDGYRFLGWYSLQQKDAEYLVSKAAIVSIKATKEDATYYAAFDKIAKTQGGIFVWEGGSVNMTMVWRSKVYESSKPFNPSACRVDSVQYPVGKLKVEMYSAPDAHQAFPASIDDATAGKLTGRTALPTDGGEGAIESQSARRLPFARPERYMQIEVRHNAEVDAILVGTSMGGLAR